MELSATQVIGGALAAASAATAASLLGVYGTVIGAVVVSVLASVGGAVYTHSFRKGRQAIVKVRESRTGRMVQVRDDGTELPTDEADLAGAVDGAADETTAEGTADGGVKGEPGWRRRLAGINPRAVAVTAACVLVLSFGGIVFAEQVLLGKPISSALGHGDDKGGNSLSRLSGDDSSGSRQPPKSPTDTPTATPTTTVTKTATPEQPTTTAPTRQPTSSRPPTSAPTSPPPSSSKPTTSKAGGTSSVGSTSGEREQAPEE